MPRPLGYSASQIALHWLTALLVLFNYIYSEGMGRMLDARLNDRLVENPPLNPGLHVWVGVAVLGLVALRLALRRLRGAPAAPGEGLIRQAAVWGHRGLYLLLVAAPLLGGLAWFGRSDLLAEPHALAANLLLLLAAGHAGMALYHHYLRRDGLILRMMRPQ